MYRLLVPISIFFFGCVAGTESEPTGEAGLPLPIDASVDYWLPEEGCDDGNPCTEDVAGDRYCSHELIDDGSLCSAFPVMVCNKGACN